jgi:hypothetical protein
MAEPVVPLSVKLGIRDGSSLVILHLPRNLALDLPPEVSVHRRLANCDVALAFFTRHDLLEVRLDALGSIIFPSGGLWIAWPRGPGAWQPTSRSTPFASPRCLEVWSTTRCARSTRRGRASGSSGVAKCAGPKVDARKSGLGSISSAGVVVAA